MKLTKVQRNLIITLERLTNDIRKGVHDAEGCEQLAATLDDTFDALRDEDFFGTEAQLDPRGDGRESGTWAIARKVQA